MPLLATLHLLAAEIETLNSYAMPISSLGDSAAISPCKQTRKVRFNSILILIMQLKNVM
jgi:hypothetical protein